MKRAILFLALCLPACGPVDPAGPDLYPCPPGAITNDAGICQCVNGSIEDPDGGWECYVYHPAGGIP